MDLIYSDANKVDIGVLKDFTLDLAFGEDENDFELTMPLSAHCLEADYIIYIEDTEYGGIVDEFDVNTEKSQISYVGRTWHGILNSKVITPADGEDYYVVSGEANTIVAQVIEDFTLSDLFEASTEDSGITLEETNVERYVSAYNGLLDVFLDNNAKLQFSYNGEKCIISVVPLVDYSESEEFNSDQLVFIIKKNFNPINHLICLGSGELADRLRLDLYADEDGNISTTQTIFGLEERVSVYDYSSVSDTDELETNGRKEFANERDDGDINITISETQSFDILDKVAATEETTGITVTKHIAKKIVTIEKGLVSVSYQINE